VANIFPQLVTQPPFTFRWAEYSGGDPTGSTSDGSYSHDGVSVAIQIIIDWVSLEDALLQILGWSERVSTPTALDPFGLGVFTELRRHLPMQHPRSRQLWAQKVSSVKSIQMVGKTKFTTGYLTTCSYILLTIQFGRPNFPIYSDSACPSTFFPGGGGWTYRKEWERFTDRHWSGTVEMITRRGASWRFADGPGLFGPQGHQVPGSMGQRIQKGRLKRKWYQIPEPGIYDVNGFPARFLSATNQPVPVPGLDTLPSSSSLYPMAGCVNSQPFLGCPKNTLLCETPTIIQRPLPFPQELIGLGLGERYVNQYDIEFSWLFFNPPRGVKRNILGVITGPIDDSPGWQGCPYAGDGLWYPIQTQSGFDGTYATMFRQADFGHLGSGLFAII
jgi:hypothetical protein